MSQPTEQRAFLNTNCGVAGPSRLQSAFIGPEWREVRFDVVPAPGIDLVGNLADLRGVIGDATFDGVWAPHNLVRLWDHEVPLALAEFARILKPDGFALVSSPDLAAIAQFVTEKGLDAVAYESPAGPITPIDLIFGYRPAMAAGHRHLAHRTGFTAQRMARLALANGFHHVRVARTAFDFVAVLLKPGCRTLEVAPYGQVPDLRSLFKIAELARAGG